MMQTNNSANPNAAATPLQTIMLAAILQGLGLTGLHYFNEYLPWPDIHYALLAACAFVALIIPLTMQLLAAYPNTRIKIQLLAVFSVVVFYFGWHVGSSEIDPKSAGDLFNIIAPAIVYIQQLLLLSALVLPFMQMRLAKGQWSLAYADWFHHLWRNQVAFFQALLFLSIFWLLISFWGSIFRSIDIDIFRDILRSPPFMFIASALVFAIALHLLSASVPRLTQLILEHLINALKWLAIITGPLLAVFTIAVIIDLPQFDTGFMLGSMIALLLSLNAAYRDGSILEPFPQRIAFALRCILLCLPIIAGLTLYNLLLDDSQLGLTVDYIWSLIVAAMILFYALGYALAAIKKGPWMQGMGRVNTIANILLILLLSATMTPLLSPERLTAESQFAYALQVPDNVTNSAVRSEWESSFYTLGYRSGEYGKAKLQLLANFQDGEHAVLIRDAARQVIESGPGLTDQLPEAKETFIDELEVFPAGSRVDAELRAQVIEHGEHFGLYLSTRSAFGVFADLNSDGQDEFMLFYEYGDSPVYSRQHGGPWQVIGSINRWKIDDFQDMKQALKNNSVRIQAVEPPWKLLQLGHSLRLDVQETPNYDQINSLDE